MARSLFVSSTVVGSAHETVYILTDAPPTNYGQVGVSLPLANIQTPDGAPIRGAAVELTRDGTLPRFLGPDAVTTLTVLRGDGTTSTITGTADPDTSGGGSGTSSTVVTKTANYTATASDVVLCDASGGDFTVALPAPASGSWVVVKNTGASGIATVATPGAAHIDGADTLAISPPQSFTLMSDGTDWWKI